MPYKDRDKQRAYVRDYMRDYMRKKREWTDTYVTFLELENHFLRQELKKKNGG